MSKKSSPIHLSKALGIGIAILQVLDIAVHAATDQLEILRVSSNGVILLWLAVVVFGKFKSKVPAIGAIGMYLLLNLIFLAREGVTNPEQGGGLRVALFLFVILTTALSTLLAFIRKD